MNKVSNYFFVVGKKILFFLSSVGNFVIFSVMTFYYSITYPWYFRQFFFQMFFVGFNSLITVAFTSLVTGAVLALQVYVGSSRFNAESTVVAIVVVSIVRELGPIVTGFVVAGRVSSSMAAEIGTMRVTEQIDAMKTLSVEPFRYVIVPKVLATTLVMPCLVLVSDVIGVLGGYIISVGKIGFSHGIFMKYLINFLELEDIISGLVKAFFFGLLLSLAGCYCGYYCEKGAQGVGEATTKAVVSSFILILIVNYFITEFFFVF